ncbi:MAG: hypothetical protein ACT4PG_12670 [Panacagrimonas sp.]
MIVSTLRFLHHRLPGALIAGCLCAPSIVLAQTADLAPAVEREIGLDPMARRYQLGQGYRISDSGFTLGGYGEATVRDEKGRDAQAALDALSMILWWDGGGRWHFFSELELEDALVAQPGDTTTDEAEWVLERFYVDYTRSDALKLRLGKFLTPVGRWNLIHAAPLTWTTSRPLITEATFPTNTTGGMVYGVLPWGREGLEYSLYATPGEELLPEQGLDTFKEAIGARLATSLLPNTQFGFSYVNFEQERSTEERKQLFGADFLWSWHRYELSGEIAYRNIARGGDSRDEEGLYLQFVAPLAQKLYAVARYETFHVSQPDQDLQLVLGGLNYRFMPALTLKAEVSDISGDTGDFVEGFLASIAVLF